MSQSSAALCLYYVTLSFSVLFNDAQLRRHHAGALAAWVEEGSARRTILKILFKVVPAARHLLPTPPPMPFCHPHQGLHLLKDLRPAYEPVIVQLWRSQPRLYGQCQFCPVLFGLVSIINIIPAKTWSAVSAKSSLSLAFRILSHFEHLP